VWRNETWKVEEVILSWKAKLGWILVAALSATSFGYAQQGNSLENSALRVSVRSEDGSYEVWTRGSQQPVLISDVAAEVDHHWLRSKDYPHHQTTEAEFNDTLGHGTELTTRFSGLAGQPELQSSVKLYDDLSYATVSMSLHNTLNRAITVQALRSVEAIGEPKINLHGPAEKDRVMSESFSEDPPMEIGSLAEAPKRTYFGVRLVLIYNASSKESLLVAALTTNRFLTISHLNVTPSPQTDIAAFTVDSTGTTEAVTKRDQIPRDQQIELSLSVPPGKELDSERLMLAAGPDYHAQLEAYGQAVRELHHARVSGEAPIGWWSWTAFYGGINEGEVLTNANWLANHLKALGFGFLHIDEGYEYARGEYTTANATQFPHGMEAIGRKICHQGLKFGIWTAPFEVSDRSWVYEHHKDWLVHDSQGKPIQVDYVTGLTDPVFALDTTNPAAQDYLKQTYLTLTRDWGVRYIKLDFMDSSAVEGYFHRPNTTALEAQRIGLEIIRKAVGPGVLLDKDGSELLNPVGLVDEGRISVDTGHSFESSKIAAVNIAGRYYMDRNFYVSDPDAFNISEQMIPHMSREDMAETPLNLQEAQVAIVMAAVTGGMYEIGDDLVTLGSEPDRLALVENPELLDMVKLGRAAVPLDLMTFPREDEHPGVFFLREDPRQGMLAVFNWTEQSLSHNFSMVDLGFSADHPYQAFDVLNRDTPVPLENGVLKIDGQPTHSVRLIKFVDSSIPAAAPSVMIRAADQARAGDEVKFFAQAAASGVPAISYKWDFGDGTDAEGAEVTHTFTHAASYKIELTVQGFDGVAAHKSLTVNVTGFPDPRFDLLHNRRYKAGEDH
jgi:alpha-galactosidase